MPGFRICPGQGRRSRRLAGRKSFPRAAPDTCARSRTRRARLSWCQCHAAAHPLHNRRTVPGPGFYFLNMGACWKDSGEECNFDITTDVTRYVLFQLPDISKGDPLNNPGRCGPGSNQLMHCPFSHTYRNGTTVHLGDPGFPYRAYHSVSSRTPLQTNTARAVTTSPPPPFRCKHDCWSNPQEQDWVRAEPSPEWAECVTLNLPVLCRIFGFSDAHLCV